MKAPKPGDDTARREERSPRAIETATEDQFRSIFEHSIDAILLATPEGKLLAANPEACRMFGRTEAELCAIGRPAILDPDDPKLHALLRERARTGVFRGELLFKRKDGSRFPGEISSAFYQDRSGQRLASVTIRDVSERKRAEELIQTAAAAVASSTGAEFFPALVRHLAAALQARHAFITECADPTNARVRMLAFWRDDRFAENREYDVTGTPCQEVLGGEACWHSHDLQQRFPGDRFLASVRAESFLGIPLFGASGQVIGHMVALDDKPMASDPRGLPVLRIFAARAAAELARLQSERRLHETNQFLQEIIDGAAEGIIVYDRDLRYVVFNRFMEQLHERSAGEVLGRRAPDVFPFVRESGIDSMVKRALEGEVVHAPDLLLRKPGRPDVWESYRVGPHRDAHGDIVGAIALVRDMTERKQAEEALRQANAEIESLNEQLEAENVYLRRDLIANVSHDLRTPLAALHGYLETLLMKGESLPPEKRRSYLETAARQSEHMGTLISELFELVKLDFKGFEIHPEPVQLGELAQDVLQKFHLAAEKKGIALEADIAAGLPSVQADIGLIERALDNLIDNALRHTPSGGVVSLAVTASDGRVEIRVADTGRGIPAAEIPHIFERFYRVDKSRTTGTGGAGLGLAIVKRIIDLHGVRMEVTSAPNEGAAFSFALPATKNVTRR
jgi:PAS domain S-box-containing protein